MAAWPLIGRDIFDFSSETAERNSTKLDRKQDLNVLYQVSVFCADQKNKMAALVSDSPSRNETPILRFREVGYYDSPMGIYYGSRYQVRSHFIFFFKQTFAKKICSRCSRRYKEPFRAKHVSWLLQTLHEIGKFGLKFGGQKYNGLNF